MSGPMHVEQLSAGDVLLYRSNTWVAKAIRLLDGTEVSHAGLYLGDEVAEALVKEGLIKRPLNKSIEDCDWVQVRRLKADPGTIQPVMAIARSYLDQSNRYAYEQILLLAGICLTRKLDLQSTLLRRLVRAAMRKAAGWLEDLHGEGKEPMICSEFVFRTYDEALPEPDDPYSLEIRSQAASEPRRRFSRFRRRRRLFGGETPPEAPTWHPDSLLAQLQAAGDTPVALSAAASRVAGSVLEPEEDLDALIEQYLADVEGVETTGLPGVAAGPEVSMDDLFDSARRLTAGLTEATVRKAGIEDELYGVHDGLAEAAPRTFDDILADFVTPGDLLKSPSLEVVDTIHP